MLTPTSGYNALLPLISQRFTVDQWKPEDEMPFNNSQEKGKRQSHFGKCQKKAQNIFCMFHRNYVSFLSGAKAKKPLELVSRRRREGAAALLLPNFSNSSPDLLRLSPATQQRQLISAARVHDVATRR